jgi:hypothetical protein
VICKTLPRLTTLSGYEMRFIGYDQLLSLATRVVVRRASQAPWYLSDVRLRYQGSLHLHKSCRLPLEHEREAGLLCTSRCREHCPSFVAGPCYAASQLRERPSATSYLACTDDCELLARCNEVNASRPLRCCQAMRELSSLCTPYL